MKLLSQIDAGGSKIVDAAPGTASTDVATYGQTPAGGSTATVPQGGTGETALTPYAVLAGGATSAGAVQQVAALGASGTVLTSNGPGALPSFQAPSGGGSGPSPGLSYALARNFAMA